MILENITLDILAEKILTEFDSKKFVKWAVDVMELGYNSENLFILAGLDNESTEIREKYFWNTVNELKINVEKSDAELIQNYAKTIAKKVVMEEIDVDYAFKIMLRICSTTGYEERYITFDLIEEDLEYLYYDNSTFFNSTITKENRNEYIKEEFRIFYEMENLNIPLKVRNLWYCKNCKALTKPELKIKFQNGQPNKNETYCCPKCKVDNFENDDQKTKTIIINRYKKRNCT